MFEKTHLKLLLNCDIIYIHPTTTTKQTKMKIFFAEVNPEEYTHAETDEMFEDPDTGNHYFYMIDTDEDGCVRLHDTCGRMVPFDLEQIEALCEATYALQEIINLKATVEERVRDDIQEVIDCTHQYTGVRILG